MEIKFVYVVTSSDKDIFLEQAWLSIYSLRLYNDNAHVVLLVDDKTKDSFIDKRKGIEELVDEILVIETPKEMSAKLRSRYIKTNIRNYVTGDFLFLDTDTIICSSLDDLDTIEGDVCMVPDYHDEFQNILLRDFYINILKKLYNVDVRNAKYYFNSGAIFCRDTPIAHELFRKWHNNWVESLPVNKNAVDQVPLLKTDCEMHYVIKEMPGYYNCQLLRCLKYFYSAKVLHFFNTQELSDASYHPFFTKEPYMELKQAGFVTQNLDMMIKNVKSLFSPVSVVVGKKDYQFYRTPLLIFLYKNMQNNSLLYRCIQKTTNMLRCLAKKIRATRTTY